MGGLSSFAIEVECTDAKDLVIKAWNSLWLFGLMSLACAVPCQPLFAFSDEPDARYSLVNRNLVVRPHGDEKALEEAHVDWMRQHHANYDHLIGDDRFSAAMRAYNNAHYLFDADQQLMLIWAGIEGLLGIDGELRRRLALYAAILLEGSKEEKVQRFNETKSAYDFRSKVVHGASPDRDRMQAQSKFAAKLLAELLIRCVVLGRVPSARELDEAALSASIS
jgi:hypothetical protein